MTVMTDYDALLKSAYEVVQGGRKEVGYNIFKVMAVSEKEVLMCRVLANFLNPQGLHGRGTAYLEPFLKEVLHRADAGVICQTARVYKEYPITADRRIDLVIAADEVFIPIEVKIFAGEQRAQCFDYYRYARERDPSAKVVYLTIHGSEPSDYSLSSVDQRECISTEDCICISFTEDITSWLELLIGSETDPALRSILSQYKEAVKSFTGRLDEGIQMKLVDTIMASEENFRGMLAISSVADRAKAALIRDVLSEMDVSMAVLAEKYRLERENRFRWYEYEDQADQDFYKQRVSTYPGINYLFKEVRLPGDIQLWLRVEVDYTLFFGLCLFDPHADSGNGDQCDDPPEAVKKALKRYLDDSYAAYEFWWVMSWFLPTGAEQEDPELDQVPNFKAMNEAAVELSDRDKRRAFIERSLAVIDGKLDHVLKSQQSMSQDLMQPSEKKQRRPRK